MSPAGGDGGARFRACETALAGIVLFSGLRDARSRGWAPCKSLPTGSKPRSVGCRLVYHPTPTNSWE